MANAPEFYQGYSDYYNNRERPSGYDCDQRKKWSAGYNAALIDDENARDAKDSLRDDE